LFTRILFALALAAAASRANDARVAVAVRTSEKIRIDGVLNEKIWSEAPDIGGFVQREPNSGVAPTEPTKVWVVYSKDALYIGVRCFDSHPEQIVARQMMRDGRLRDDDQLEILIDTFNDGRNAYYFATNPAGALQEARITENGQFNMDWDGIWNLRTRIDEQGWTAEFEIPFKTLGFNPRAEGWGFNVQRTLLRLREQSRWASPSYDANFFQVSKAGTITGIGEISQGRGLDVKPYGLLGYSRDITRADVSQGVRDGGLDIFYRVTPNLMSTTTINTDFAETEVDTRQVNLTRFPLFFPEKRAFFLEDAGIFNFAPAAVQDYSHSSDFVPFFSRRIGMVNGEEVPILAGTKLTGKIGRFDVGLMDIRTRDSDAAPAENFTVGRIKANFLKESYIGALFTNGEPTGITRNSLGGIDMRLGTSNLFGTGKNFSITAFGSKTYTRGLVGHDNAWGVDVNYPNDEFAARYQWRVIGENYDPALGFVARPATRYEDIRLEYRPRPHLWNVRQMFHAIEYSSYFNLANHAVESRKAVATPFKWQFQSGQAFDLNYQPQFERLFVPFEIHPGIFIPAGAYWFHRGVADYNSPQDRPLLLEASWTFGGFYTGTDHEVNTTLTWRKDRHVSTSIQLQQFFVDLPQGSFRTRLALYKLDYAFTPFLSLSNFIQYDTDSRNLGVQSRLRWIVTPGNELFFVVNHAWEQNTLDRFEAVRTNVRAKLNYTFRF
jgi:hypothetical protein